MICCSVPCTKIRRLATVFTTSSWYYFGHSPEPLRCVVKSSRAKKPLQSVTTEEKQQMAVPTWYLWRVGQGLTWYDYCAGILVMTLLIHATFSTK